MESFRAILNPERQVSSKPQKEASCSNGGPWAVENLWIQENWDKFSEW